MTPRPTGTITWISAGRHDLVLTREFRAHPSDVWASITEPERTARWIGRWEGDAAVGRTIRIQLGFEADAPWSQARIDACTPDEHLGLTMTDSFGEWAIDVTLAEAHGVTTLRFVQHMTDPTIAPDVGPGWEWYLDMLVDSRDGRPLASFDDYYPAQRHHYAEQARLSREWELR
jgi:uncharacterized protein YndB with AHSA1/START domain